MALQIDSHPRLARPELRAGDRAAAPRTLVDTFAATARHFPTALALDDGSTQLTYAELADQVQIQADRLAAAGIRRGDRVGVRIRSGTAELYVGILAVLHAGAAYVPVDADDPLDRAMLVFDDASVRLVLGDGLSLARVDGGAVPLAPEAARADLPGPADDAWVIFTSGSTGRPKGVAVTHRSAAALVDAEAGLFLADSPLGPGDRVLAGLSVTFDASCEEMWLAWRHGAALIPAPRSLMRSGAELADWLARRAITAVSTVPTLAALWPAESLSTLRLLIFGGEAVAEHVVSRLWRPDLELWNTYGPTETTVVACAARLTPGQQVRIGAAIPGWDLEVVGPDGAPVADGEVGELVVGGVGLARYLDPELDAQRFAPLASLVWQRAYRTGDRVRADRRGLVFIGRTDDQVKVNGRRVELAEVDAALNALPGVSAAAAAVRVAPTGGTLLVGYVVADGAGFDARRSGAALRRVLPAALVPLLVVVAELPRQPSGKVDREALPWPAPPAGPDLIGPGRSGATRPERSGAARCRRTGATRPERSNTTTEVAEAWAAVLGVGPSGPDDDFFARGGSSLGAALLAAQLRERHPRLTVAAVYDNPTVAELAAHLDADRGQQPDPLDEPPPATPQAVGPVPLTSRALQLLALVPLRTAVALRWLTVLAVLNIALALAGVPWAAPLPLWWVLAGVVLTMTPPGRMGLTALVARCLLAGVGPGSYPRGGHVHLRVWAAQRFADGFGAMTPATAPWVSLYARALGARVGPDVDLHAVPPVTGLLTLGRGCAVEREVDLSGCWLDGDVLHVGRVTVGPGARVGARSLLHPGARVGAGAQVAAGSTVLGTVPPGEHWAGSPAVPGPPQPDAWPVAPARPRRRAGWTAAFAAAGATVAALPLLALAPGAVLVLHTIAAAPTLGAAVLPALAVAALGSVMALVGHALLVIAAVRVLSLGLRPGCHPVRSWTGVRAWAVERLTDSAGTTLFPLYSAIWTPMWLRALGARVGRGAEISTVTGLPTMMRVKAGSFLADDTLLAHYELRDGWLRIAPATVGARAFLGNSGMAAPGRKVPKRALVGVLSAAPDHARKGSSYLGSPPALIPRAPVPGEDTRTYQPSIRRRAARAAVESLRIVPVAVVGLIAAGILLALQALALAGGWELALASGGLVLLAAGATAALVTVAAKWLLVGRYRRGTRPLWSAAVWRGELADTFTEVVAAPFAAEPALGTPALLWWLRAMGARIGRGVWCETYWLPEADLVRIEAGANVGPGCVVQTHLFHDRVMSLDAVRIGAGATLGANSVALPGALLAPGCVVGPGSLVLRGEHLPAGRWTGNAATAWPGTPTSGTPTSGPATSGTPTSGTPTCSPALDGG